MRRNQGDAYNNDLSKGRSLGAMSSLTHAHEEMYHNRKSPACMSGGCEKPLS